MGDATGISWADSTFNPWVGCSKVSPGCAHCYAENWAIRYADGAVWGDDGVRRRTSAALWKKPLAWERDHEAFEAETGHRRRVFCASLADVFEDRRELDPWRHDLFRLIEGTPNLDWLVLTKRPDIARVWLLYSDHPNLWLGTSIENSRFTWRADYLRRTNAAVRFISAEPLLGSLFEDARSPRLAPPTREESGHVRAPLDLTGIDWVIVGGESGAKSVARSVNPEWVREIRDAVLAVCGACDYAADELCSDPRPAFHFKQWGSHDADGVYRGSSPTSGGKLLDGVDWCEVPSATHQP